MPAPIPKLNRQPWAPVPTDGGTSSRGSHKISDLLTCERRAYLAHVVGWRPLPERVKDYFVQGSIFHALAAHALAKRLPELPTWATKAQLSATINGLIEGRPDGAKELAAMRAVFAAYRRTLLFADLRPVVVEHEYWATLGELLGKSCPSDVRDEIVSSRIDTEHLIDQRTSAIIDFKTGFANYSTGRLSAWTYVERQWKMNLQACLNLLCARARVQRNVKFFAIERVKRVEPYDFDRQILYLGNDEYEWARRLCLRAVRIELRLRDRSDSQKADGGTAPTGMATGACTTSKFGPCLFLDVCTTDPESRLVVLNNNFQKRS